MRRGARPALMALLQTSILILVLGMPVITEECQAIPDPWEIQVLGIVNGSRAYGYDVELENIAFRHYAFRAAGSSGANETAGWIKQQFESFGLEAWLEPFQFTNWTLQSRPFMVIDDDGEQTTVHDRATMGSFQSEQLSWPTPEGGVLADLVVLPLPRAAGIDQVGVEPINQTEWGLVDTTGKIVLIGREVRWTRSWEEAYRNKLSEQTPAAIVYTWWYDWMSFTPVLSYSAEGRLRPGVGPDYWALGIPTGSVNYDEGLWIRNRERAVNVSAQVSIESAIGPGTHYNVVGRIGGYEDPEKVVLISCHYDTVMCSGFCDNGAGTAGVVELARVLGDAVKSGHYRPRYTLLFVAFADEELIMVGSINYLTQHKAEMGNIIAIINLDSIGSDQLVISTTRSVSGFDLGGLALEAAQDLGIDAALGDVGGGDAEPFLDPASANDMYQRVWQIDAGISDALPMESGTMLCSSPVQFRERWTVGEPGWMHTSYDNSTSTATLGWVKVGYLASHIKVAALTALRVSPDTPVSVVSLADHNLETAVREALGKPTGDITREEMANLTSLAAVQRGIQNLTGLEYATSLQELHLDQNQISDLSPLAGLGNLLWLFLQQNQVSDLSPLASLTELEDLQLGLNKVSDLSPLAGLTQLKWLQLWRNELGDLSPLAGLTNLEQLSLDENRVSDLSPLVALTNLRVLYLEENQISDISPLVANSRAGGLATDDYVYLQHNYLNLSEESMSMIDIQALISSGATVAYSPQRLVTLMHRRSSDVINEIGGVDFAPNGTLYFCDCANTVVDRIFRVVGNVEQVVYTRAEGMTHDIAFSPNGTLYFSDSSNRVYRLLGSTEQVVYESPRVGILGIAFHPNGTLYFSDGGLPGRVYRVSQGIESVVYTRPSGIVMYLDFSGDGALYFNDWPSVPPAHLYRVSGGQESLIYTGKVDQVIRGQCMAADGMLYYTAFVDSAGCIYAVAVVETGPGVVLPLVLCTLGALARRAIIRS